MDDLGENTVTIEQGNAGTRKRKSKITSVERKKIVRYTDHFPNLEDFKRPCNHKKKPYDCASISLTDIKKARKEVYEKPIKMLQDEKIAHLMIVRTPTNLKDKEKPAQNVRVTYRFWSATKTVHKVCQKFFMSALHITQRRILNIAKKVKNCENLTEKRGGDRRSRTFLLKRTSVKSFIAKLKARESHYNRAKSQRLYLPAELNISILHKIYNSSVTDNLKVPYGYFHKVFTHDFNVGFGSPATDVCSLCTRLKHNLKVAATPVAKKDAIVNLRIHKLRAKQFTMFMNENSENTLSYCFDLQQVQVLPKLPIQEAFYARQLALYNLCITDLKSVDPTFYMWTEDQAGRGANEVGCALLNFLSSIQFPENCNFLRLFADGCAGQNKNSFVMHTLMYWLTKFAPEHLQQISVIFPVRGHSYLPADRVFGRIEKIIRRHSEILTREKYWELYQTVGKVKKLGIDWELLDTKILSDIFNKLDGISQMKRIYIKKVSNTVKIKMEINYRNDDTSKKFSSMFKKGKKSLLDTLPSIEIGRSIKKEKLNDIKNLLESFYGLQWKENEELVFYKHLIDSSNTIVSEKEPENHDCECGEDDCGVKV